jgi:hypothetical protein
MKSGLKIFLAIIAILILAGIIFFFWQRGPHLPHAQTPQAAGTFIPKNQLVFAGYKTPEASVESLFWAMIHGDYDTFIASFSANQQAKMKVVVGNPKHFKSDAKKGFSQLKGMEIMARKNVSNDKIELKLETIGGVFYAKGGNNFRIIPVVKIGKEWKLTPEKSDYDYTTNWDNSGDIVTFSN